MLPSTLFRPIELAFRTQYAELKERARNAGPLLPGTPGTLARRAGTGRAYWYRVHQNAAGDQAETLVAKDGDDDALLRARNGVAFAQWMSIQVRDLRKLEFQVADKAVAGVLVELHNNGLLSAGLCIVGTLGYMAWLNELGARAVSARTQDIDLAARQPLKLASPRSLTQALQPTRLGFVPVPGLSVQAPSTSLKTRGRDGLRIDLLVPGRRVGAAVRVPQLEWHAQTMPHYDWLLATLRPAALLAGGHCIPLSLPSPERFVWHKLYSSAARASDPEKADKDLLQAATLAAVIVERDDGAFDDTALDVPAAMLRAARKRLPALRRLLEKHPAAAAALERALQP
jgi:hypothetical protein